MTGVYGSIYNLTVVLFRIVEDDLPPLPEVSPELEDFLKLCFTKNPRDRPAAVVLFEHPWVKKLNPELVSGVLQPCASLLTISGSSASRQCPLSSPGQYA
jgi:serine/threonine protein kinase